MSVARQVNVGCLMLALALIDFAAALVAQDFADRRRVSALLLGCGLQVVLFLVYALALRVATMSIVTMGWIVLLQVAIISTDVARGGLHLRWAQWCAVTLVILAQVYLVATTNGRHHAAETVSAYADPCPRPALVPRQASATAAMLERSPVTRKTTLRATETAWSAKRS